MKLTQAIVYLLIGSLWLLALHAQNSNQSQSQQQQQGNQQQQMPQLSGLYTTQDNRFSFVVQQHDNLVFAYGSLSPVWMMNMAGQGNQQDTSEGNQGNQGYQGYQGDQGDQEDGDAEADGGYDYGNQYPSRQGYQQGFGQGYELGERIRQRLSALRNARRIRVVFYGVMAQLKQYSEGFFNETSEYQPQNQTSNDNQTNYVEQYNEQRRQRPPQRPRRPSDYYGEQDGDHSYEAGVDQDGGVQQQQQQQGGSNAGANTTAVAVISGSYSILPSIRAAAANMTQGSSSNLDLWGVAVIHVNSDGSLKLSQTNIPNLSNISLTKFTGMQQQGAGGGQGYTNSGDFDDFDE